MQTKELFNRLRQFDAYPKTLEDFRVKTVGGAAGKLNQVEVGWGRGGRVEFQGVGCGRCCMWCPFVLAMPKFKVFKSGTWLGGIFQVSNIF